MALLSKKVQRDDSQQLTVTEKMSREPFPYAEGKGLRVKDEQGYEWRFEYKVKSRNKRILSGSHWVQFFGYNNVQIDDTVAIRHMEGSGPQALFMIEVIRKP
ncbi:hypothetical protein GQ457_08G007080 [Hibiscus cannabinus]